MINRKQLYTNQTSWTWKKVNKMRHFTVIDDLNVAQKNSSMVTYLFCLLILFVMRFVILAIYFRLKTTIRERGRER